MVHSDTWIITDMVSRNKKRMVKSEWYTMAKERGNIETF